MHHPFQNLWGTGNDLDLDPGGKNSSSWTLNASVYVSYTLPASNPPPPTPARLSSCSHGFFPLLGTHFCQPQVGTSAQFLFAFWLAEHLPPASRFPLFPPLPPPPNLLPLPLQSLAGAPVGEMRERQPCLGRGIEARVPVSPPPNSCCGAARGEEGRGRGGGKVQPELVEEAEAKGQAWHLAPALTRGLTAQQSFPRWKCQTQVHRGPCILMGHWSWSPMGRHYSWREEPWTVVWESV